jgi:hypothetical protein
VPDFEIYQRQRASRPATVTLTKGGLLRLSPAAYSALGSPAAVTLAYDKEGPVIGFRAARASDRSAYLVRAPRVVSAVALCRVLAISRDESRRYPLEDFGGTLGIDLGTPGEVVTSNRRKKAGVP